MRENVQFMGDRGTAKATRCRGRYTMHEEYNIKQPHKNLKGHVTGYAELGYWCDDKLLLYP